jgi:hypothetical protein
VAQKQYLAYKQRLKESQLDKFLTRVYSKPILSVLCLVDNPETQLSHIKGWEKGPEALDTFSPPHAGALEALELSTFG